MDLIIRQDGMSEVQVQRNIESMEMMGEFFGDIVDSITAFAPSDLEEVFLFQRGEKSLLLRGKGDKYSGGFLVIDRPRKKEKKSRVKIV